MPAPATRTVTQNPLASITRLVSQTPLKLSYLKEATNRIKTEVKVQLDKQVPGLEISKFVGDANQVVLEAMLKHFFPKDISQKYGLSFVLHGGSGRGLGFINSDVDLIIVTLDDNKLWADQPGDKQTIYPLTGDLTPRELTFEPKLNPDHEDYKTATKTLLSHRWDLFSDAIREMGFPHTPHIPQKTIEEFKGEDSIVVIDKDALTYFMARTICEHNSDPQCVKAFKELYQAAEGSNFTKEKFLERAVSPRPNGKEHSAIDLIGMSEMDVKNSPGFWRTAQFGMTIMSIMGSGFLDEAQKKYKVFDPGAVRAALGTSEQFLAAFDFFAVVRHAMSLSDKPDWKSTKLTTDRLKDVAARIGRSRIEGLEKVFDLPRLYILNDEQRVLRILDECSRKMLSALSIAKNQAPQVQPVQSPRVDINLALQLVPESTVADREALRRNAFVVLDRVQSIQADPFENQVTPLRFNFLERFQHLTPGSEADKSANDLSFLRILGQPGKVGTVLRFMREYGIIESEIAPLHEVRGIVEVNSRHFFNLQEHTLKTADELDGVFNGVTPVIEAGLQNYSDIISQQKLSSEEVSCIYLAAIFHDLGKSRVGSGLEHVQRGYELIDTFIQRYGTNKEQLKEATLLVKYHHLLRKDNLEAKNLLPGLAQDGVDNERFLYKLLLLSVADLKATGKEANLTEIQGVFEQFHICRQTIGVKSEPEAYFRNLSQVVRLLPEELKNTALVYDIIAALPRGYIVGNLWEDTASVITQLAPNWTAINADQEIGSQVNVTASIVGTETQAQTVVTVAFSANDRPGLLRDVLSQLKDFNISSVKALTVKNVAVDLITFTSTAELDDSDLRKYEARIKKAINGETNAAVDLKLDKLGFEFQMERTSSGTANIKVSVKNVITAGEVAFKVMAGLTEAGLNISSASVVPENERNAIRVQVTIALPADMRDDAIHTSIADHLGKPTKLIFSSST